MAKKNNKYNFWKEFWGCDNTENDGKVAALTKAVRQSYLDKYYQLWISKYKWLGLDEERAEQEENYIMRKFYCDGAVALWPERRTGLLLAATWAEEEVNMFDFPETVILNNERGVSKVLIPETPQVVNKDVVLVWAQPNRKPIQAIVNYYADRLTNIDMVINTNLALHKMPWLIGVTEEDMNKMKDIVRRILNNEVVVYADLSDLAKIQTFATNTPYIIDKLEQHKRNLEHELMSYLGIDNNDSGKLEQTHISTDAINANNDIINSYGSAIRDEIQKGLDRYNKLFGRDIRIEDKIKPVCSVHEKVVDDDAANKKEDRENEDTRN